MRAGWSIGVCLNKNTISVGTRGFVRLPQSLGNTLIRFFHALTKFESISGHKNCDS